MHALFDERCATANFSKYFTVSAHASWKPVCKRGCRKVRYATPHPASLCRCQLLFYAREFRMRFPRRLHLHLYHYTFDWSPCKAPSKSDISASATYYQFADDALISRRAHILYRAMVPFQITLIGRYQAGSFSRHAVVV